MMFQDYCLQKDLRRFNIIPLIESLLIELIVVIPVVAAAVISVAAIPSFVTVVVISRLEFLVPFVTEVGISSSVIFSFTILVRAITFYVRSIGKFQLSFCQHR